MSEQQIESALEVLADLSSRSTDGNLWDELEADQ